MKKEAKDRPLFIKPEKFITLNKKIILTEFSSPLNYNFPQMLKRLLALIIPIGAALIVFNFLRGQSNSQPAVSQGPSQEEITVLARDLNIPWEIVFLPNNEILITERPGNLIVLGPEKKVIKVPGVEKAGEGGLLGAVLHPNYAENHFLYLYLTSKENGKLTNRVERYNFNGENLTERKIILDGIIGGTIHDGGRIAFGPDGYLYITTGDAGQEELAQDTKSLNGKILRVKDDGSLPKDNPFGNAVYSYGHRNVQGLAWDNQGRLWATEHGRSGVTSGLDELNIIEKGKNYGWPIIQGDEQKQGMITPVINSGASETWAPSGMTFAQDNIFFGGLRGETLYRYNPTERSLKKYFERELGRIRNVVLGKDNYLYILTNNTDGRGRVQAGDDKLIKINLQEN